MDREGFKNRMSLYREARAVLPWLSYWEWRQKYDAAPKPDAMPDQPLADVPTLQVEPAEDRAHRWDNVNESLNRQPFDSPYEDARYHDYRKPRFEFRKRDVRYGNPKVLKLMGRFGKLLRGGSMLGEGLLQLFPSEEAEAYENWRSWAEKQNRQMTGLEPLPVYAQGGVIENGEDEKETAIPTQEEYIAQQIAAKRAAALDKSRNRTSIRVPMINNPQSEEQWKKSMDERIRITEEQLSKSMATGDLEMAEFLQSALDNLLNQKYIPVVAGFNCMYNAGDCYGLNIPSNQVFAAKHKELGFEKADKDNLEPGDLVQDIKGRTPVHAMIYDSKDSEGNLLFNYAKGHTDSLADDMEYNYAKRGKYPMKNYDVYKYVGTPADSTQWINDYKKIYGFDEGGEVTDPIKNPVLPQSYDPYFTEWLANWLNNRRKQLYENLELSDKYITPYTLSSSAFFTKPEDKKRGDIRKDGWDREYIKNDWSVLPLLKGYSPDRVWLNKEFYRQLNNAATAPEIVITSYGDTDGAYKVPTTRNNTGHYIVYSQDVNGFDGKSLRVHERTHASNARPQEFKISQITDWGKNMGNYHGYDFYLRMPQEIYSRLMEYRHNNKLEPSLVIDVDYLNTHREQLKLHGLDIFTDDLLLKLFNDVAENTVEENRTHKSKRA